jgi:hypothetical protein
METGAPAHDGDGDGPASAGPEPRPRWGWVRRLVPWVSLLLAIGSAIWMDRSPERARLIAIAAVVGFVALGAFALLEGVDVGRMSRVGGWLARAARASAMMGAQSVIQLCLFFTAPFYLRAVTVNAHWVFMGLLGVAALATLWSPLCDAVLKQPVAAVMLQGAATFAGLGCVLPLLGVSNHDSLAWATGAVVVGAPFVVGRGLGRRALAVLITGLVLAVAALAGAAQLVPPAPLRFVAGGIGTRVVNRELVDARSVFPQAPERLVCLTAIAAPRGLKDKLRHVWRHEGTARAEAQLEIRGGRAQGFRAWSYKRNPAPGRWSCTVETESGQMLGRVTVTVGNAPPPPKRKPAEEPAAPEPPAADQEIGASPEPVTR